MSFFKKGSTLKRNLLFLTLLISSGPLIAAHAADYGPITKSPTNQIRPGQFVWADLITSDVSAAAKFYAGVFGWDNKFNSDNME